VRERGLTLAELKDLERQQHILEALASFEFNLDATRRGHFIPSCQRTSSPVSGETRIRSVS
jgi:hypothetical protein